MNGSNSLFLAVFVPGVALAFLIPAVVFVLSALTADMSLAASLRAVATRQPTR